MFSKWLSLLGVAWCVSTAAETNRIGTADHHKYIDSLWRRVERRDPHLSSRMLFDFALEATAGAHRVTNVEAALALAEAMQDRDPASRTYGNLAWYLKDGNRPDDRNAVEFCMQKASLVRMLYWGRLSEPARERLQRLIDFGVEGITRHRVRESYTNIYLMKMWNCIALGENTNRPELAAQGYAMLDCWLLYTSRCGIHEYLSPTYYGVDIECLALIARHAKREAGRRKARIALELFWRDIAANWYAPGQRLGGAHSRDYDYLTGHGHLDRALRAVGWLAADDRPGHAAFMELSAVAPPARIHGEPFTTVPRVVRQQWGERRDQFAQHYVGQRFSIGSAGATYNAMDKALTVNLPGGPKVPMMYFIMDARGDPYGKNRFETGGGHRKALHIEPDVSSVQQGAEVLLSASVKAGSRAFRRSGDAATCLLSHMVIPLSAGLYIGDDTEPLGASAPSRRLENAGTPVFVRVEDVAVGMRVLLADGAAGTPGSVEIANDGEKWGVRRLTCVHTERPLEGQVTVAFWVRAMEGLDERGFKAFRTAFSSAAARVERTADALRISAEGIEGPMELKSRPGDETGGEYVDDLTSNPPPLLSVNGKDVGRQLLSGVDVVKAYQTRLNEIRRLEPSQAMGEAFEAESGVTLSAFEVGETKGVRYLWLPGQEGQDGSQAARAIWMLRVPTDGKYSLWGRILSPTPKDDSFYVRVVQEGEAVVPRVDWHTGVHKHWEWARFPRDLTLKAGTARLEIHAREDGTRLDSLFVGTGDTRPDR